MDMDKDNLELKGKYNQIINNIKNKLPSIPSILSDEMRLNIFLKFDDLKFKEKIGFKDLNEVDFFKKIRDLKDNF
jgi:hydroxyacylglutathione hydrolase